jgi:hypothetical protein
MSRRTLSDLLAQDQLEYEAEDARREAEADMETERRSAAYWEENHSPAYQEECRQDLELFELTWGGNSQGCYRDDEARATNEDYR